MNYFMIISRNVHRVGGKLHNIPLANTSCASYLLLKNCNIITSIITEFNRYVSNTFVSQKVTAVDVLNLENLDKATKGIDCRLTLVLLLKLNKSYVSLLKYRVQTWSSYFQNDIDLVGTLCPRLSVQHFHPHKSIMYQQGRTKPKQTVRKRLPKSGVVGLSTCKCLNVAETGCAVARKAKPNYNGKDANRKSMARFLYMCTIDRCSFFPRTGGRSTGCFLWTPKSGDPLGATISTKFCPFS